MAHCTNVNRGCHMHVTGHNDCDCRCAHCVAELDLGESSADSLQGETCGIKSNLGWRCCVKVEGHLGPHLDNDGEWTVNGYRDSSADGSAAQCDAETQSGRCQRSLYHSERHRGASGHEWGSALLCGQTAAGQCCTLPMYHSGLHHAASGQEWLDPAGYRVPDVRIEPPQEPEFRPCGRKDPYEDACFLASGHSGPHETSQGEWANIRDGDGEDQCREFQHSGNESVRRSTRCTRVVGHSEPHCTRHGMEWPVVAGESPQCDGKHNFFGVCMHVFDHTGPHVSVSGHQWHGDSSLADIEPSASVMWNQGGPSVTAGPRRGRSSDAPLPQELLDGGDRLNRELEWVTGDGRRVLIAEMETGHLMNTIRYLERSGTRNASYKAMVKEAARRVSGVGAALGVAEFPEARQEQAAAQQRASLSPEERERRETEHRAAAAAERVRQLADRALRDAEREQARLARARLEAEALMRRQELERQESARVVQELHRRWLRRWENFMTAVVMALDVRGLVFLARIFAYGKGPVQWKEEFLLRAPDAMARGSLLEIDVAPLKGE